MQAVATLDEILRRARQSGKAVDRKTAAFTLGFVASSFPHCNSNALTYQNVVVLQGSWQDNSWLRSSASDAAEQYV